MWRQNVRWASAGAKLRSSFRAPSSNARASCTERASVSAYLVGRTPPRTGTNSGSLHSTRNRESALLTAGLLFAHAAAARGVFRSAQVGRGTANRFRSKLAIIIHLVTRITSKLFANPPHRTTLIAG